MQEFLVNHDYPDKFVPPSVMNYAKSIDDIRDNTRFVLISDGLNQDIILEYINKDVLVSLGFCRFTVLGFHTRMKILYTSNLCGLDTDTKIKETIYQRIHILASPIKYLGKEIFVKFLDICKEKRISSVKLTPYEQTNSIVFYQNMAKYFPDRIETISYDEKGDIIFFLK